MLRSFLDPDILTKAIKEFTSTLASLSVPNIRLRAKKLFEDALKSDSFKNADSSEEIIRSLLDLVQLPHEASVDLQNLLLFSMNRKKKTTVQYQTRNAANNSSKGKQISSISKLRQQFIELTKKCKLVETCTTTNDPQNIPVAETTDNSTQLDTITDCVDTITEVVEAFPIDPNNESTNDDELTEQVLTLPRKFRPIDLKNDRILQTDNDIINGNISVTTITVPKLPAMIPNNVICTGNGNVGKKVSKKSRSKIHQLIDLLDQPEYMKRELPSKHLRETSMNIEADNKSKYRRLVTLGYKMTVEVVRTLCPDPSKDQLFNDILAMLNKHMDKSVENDRSSTIKQKYDKLSSALCLCTKNSKKNTIERKVCRAILYKGTSNKQLSCLLKQHSFTFSTGEARAVAKEDFESLMNGDPLTKTKRTYSIISEDVLHKAVNFILSENNVVSISYGTKKVKLSKYEIIELPSLTRKRSMHDIFKAYMGTMKENEKSLSRASMFNLMGHLTNQDEAVLTAIDYVTAVLINEPCELLQDIIDKVICTSKQKHVTQLLHSAKHFLKHKYKSHVVTEDDICYHGLQYCLGRSMTTKLNNNCQSCKFPFYVCFQLEKLVKDESSMCVDNEQMDDAVEVIKHAS